jgi:hypothetical protein
MIGNVLTHIAGELNAYVCRHQGLSPDIQKVLLSTIVNPDGSMAPREENVILLSLMDVRQEAASPNMHKAQYQTPAGVHYKVNTIALHVNLYLLFSMYFEGDKTRESLNFLTYVLRFFQVKSVFTRHNSPGLPAGVDKLEFSLETQDFQQKSHMWGLLGVKYMPFVLFKARVLSIIDNEPEEFIPPITETETRVR